MRYNKFLPVSFTSWPNVYLLLQFRASAHGISETIYRSRGWISVESLCVRTRGKLRIFLNKSIAKIYPTADLLARLLA
jgi:hypothetical protein